MQVSDAVSMLGLSHDNEYVTEDGLFSVDIALRGRQIALEVDGPFHFTVNTLAPTGMNIFMFLSPSNDGDHG